MDEKEKRIIEEEILGRDHAGYAISIHTAETDRNMFLI